MSRSLALVLGPVLLSAAPAAAQNYTFEGEVDAADGVAYFALPFEVPAGTAEIEIRHDDLSAANILDWGLLSPSGFRGYGGGNEEPAIVNAEAASRSYLTGPIEPGMWQVYVGEAKLEELPARYRVEVFLREAVTLPAEPTRAPYAPPAPIVMERRWYAGDFHVHSRESGDSPASLDDVLGYAESVGLDFVMLSEHNTVSQLERYAEVQARHPTVLLIPGIEVTTYEGHFMSLGGTRWIDHRLGVEGRTLDELADDVHGGGALFTVNHPALDIGDLCIGCGWSGNVRPDAVDGIEIQTGAFSVTGRLFLGRVLERWDELVVMGHHVAAIGGSDDHRAGTGTGAFDSPIGSPTTMVLAEALSVEAILAGLRAGRTVVRLEGNEDPMVELSSPDLEDGADTIVADHTTLGVRVTGAELGARLRLVRDGEPHAEAEVTGADVELDFPLVASASEDAIRAELLVGGQRRVITSHVFLRPRSPGGGDAGPVDGGRSDAGPAPAPGGCGCAAGGGSRSLWPWTAMAIAAGLWRRRARASTTAAVSGCSPLRASTT
jgi:hypothetical protein